MHADYCALLFLIFTAFKRNIKIRYDNAVLNIHFSIKKSIFKAKFHTKYHLSYLRQNFSFVRENYEIFKYRRK